MSWSKGEGGRTLLVPTSTTSPLVSHTGFAWPNWTPSGLRRINVRVHHITKPKIEKRGRQAYVPVKMISPGCSVMPIEKKDTNCLTPKIISAVLAFCFITPFTFVWTTNCWGSGITLVDTIAGPHGPQPSASFPSIPAMHLLRSLTSLYGLACVVNAQRFVRFVGTDGQIHFGDAILPDNSTDARLSTSARLIDGDILGSFNITNQVMVGLCIASSASIYPGI